MGYLKTGNLDVDKLSKGNLVKDSLVKDNLDKDGLVKETLGTGNLEIGNRGPSTLYTTETVLPNGMLNNNNCPSGTLLLHFDALRAAAL